MYDAPESKTIVTGSSVALTCVASSAQQATITWSTTLDSDISGAAVSFNSVRYRFFTLRQPFSFTVWKYWERYIVQNLSEEIGRTMY